MFAGTSSNNNYSRSSPQANAPHGFTRFLCVSCGAFRDVAVRCGKRSCVPCFNKRSLTLVARLHKAYDSYQKPKYTHWNHMVFATKCGDDLKERIKYHVRCFAKVRRSRIWRSKVIGGFYTIEAKRKPWGWYVHLHVVVLSFWVNHGLIRKEWSAACGNNSYFHNTAIKSDFHLSKIISYVVKYITKSNLISENNEYEFDNAFKGRHIIAIFGRFTKIWRERTDVKPIFKCIYCGGTHWYPEWLLRRLEKRSVCYNTS